MCPFATAALSSASATCHLLVPSSAAPGVHSFSSICTHSLVSSSGTVLQHLLDATDTLTDVISPDLCSAPPPNSLVMPYGHLRPTRAKLTSGHSSSTCSGHSLPHSANGISILPLVREGNLGGTRDVPVNPVGSACKICQHPTIALRLCCLWPGARPPGSLLWTTMQGIPHQSPASALRPPEAARGVLGRLRSNSTPSLPQWSHRAALTCG